jgi:hypothetical protein
MSACGSSRSSHAGSHQAALPSMPITAGTRNMRTTNASMNTPMASPNPIDLMTGSGLKAKPANTHVMITAAAVTTRAPCPTPETTASSAEPECTKSSRIRDTRNTS